jgi:hypothetical protein
MGLMIGANYPEAVSAGYNNIANKTWSTIRATTSGIYAKVMEAIPKPASQGKAE